MGNNHLGKYLTAGATSNKRLSIAPVVDEGSAKKREMTLMMVGEMLVKKVRGHQLDNQLAFRFVMNIYIPLN